jgi:hypothetical protein
MAFRASRETIKKIIDRDGDRALFFRELFMKNIIMITYGGIHTDAIHNHPS